MGGRFFRFSFLFAFIFVLNPVISFASSPSTVRKSGSSTSSPYVLTDYEGVGEESQIQTMEDGLTKLNELYGGCGNNFMGEGDFDHHALAVCKQIEATNEVCEGNFANNLIERQNAMMIDLYALHEGFPGAEAAQRHRRNPYRRVEALEEAWANETGDLRFIPHIQLHEYEAYLFTDLSVLSSYYEGQERRLKRSVGCFNSPEMINDGPHTAPSKRIIDYFPRYDSDKLTVGVQAAARIGLPRIRRGCPHFARWVERLEGLAARNAD